MNDSALAIILKLSVIGQWYSIQHHKQPRDSIPRHGFSCRGTMGLGAADQPWNRVSRDDDYQIRALCPKFASRGNYHDSGGYHLIPKTRLKN